MTTVPVGARLSTVTEIAAVVAVFPEVSRARACSVCVPFDAVVVFQEKLYGEVVSSVPSSVLPSSRNCTPATATLSDAVAVRVTVPRRIELAAGPDQVTVGAVVSETAAVVNVLLALTVSFPAASMERTRQL